MTTSTKSERSIAGRTAAIIFTRQNRGPWWLAATLALAACSAEERLHGAAGTLAPADADREDGARPHAGEPDESADAGAFRDDREGSADEQSRAAASLRDGGAATVSGAVTVSSAASEASSLCAIDARDGDGDGLCDAAEAHFKTNPADPDTDRDSLRDGAEIHGIVVQGAGEDGAPALLDLRALHADPLHRDVFVEVDYYDGLAPSSAAIEMVEKAFREAPVSNPDGHDGITLHVLIDDVITGELELPWLGDEGTVDASETSFPTDVYRDFKRIKDKYAHPARHAADHYAVFARSIRNSSATGVSFQINGHDFAVTLGHLHERTDLTTAGTFMHELGHNLGLYHGGASEIPYAPNYLSVMNYLYQRKGLVRKAAGAPAQAVLYHGETEDPPLQQGYEAVVDYSRVRVASLSEWAVKESDGLQPGRGTDEETLAAYGVRHCRFPGMVAYDPTRGVDFDLSGDISAEVYDQDLNCDGKGEVFPESQNDWQVLKFDGRGSIGEESSWERYRAGTYELVSDGPCEPPIESPEEGP